MSRKDTVERSLVLAVKDFRKSLHPYGSGSFTWTWGSGAQASIGYSVTFHGECPVVNLEYRSFGEEIRIPVRMQTTPTQFGGQRWWFTCPLIVNGVPCQRRVGKLYSSSRSRYFGCRTCQGLTYRSCQEAHSEERRVGTVEGQLAYLDALKQRYGIE